MRLPFLAASLAPYFAGAARAGHWRLVRLDLLFAGAVVVGSIHLAANLVNELADAVSGVDALDATCYGLYGGSKQLVRGAVPARWYRAAVLWLIGSATLTALWIGFRMGSWWPPCVTLAAGGVAVLYSVPPVCLMNRGLGEAAVALLFGPVTTVAGAYVQGVPLGDPGVWIGAAVLGLLTGSVLVANEVPDAVLDARVGKRTLVVRIGVSRGWFLYSVCVLAAWSGLIAGLYGGSFGTPVRLGACVIWPLPVVSAWLQRTRCNERKRLLPASILAVACQILVALSLICDGFQQGFCRRSSQLADSVRTRPVLPSYPSGRLSASGVAGSEGDTRRTGKGSVTLPV